MGDLPPHDIVLTLARAKAEAVASGAVDPETGGALDGLVLGGDSMFEIDGAVVGKPHEPAVARERWLAQRGKTGTLWSGHWLVDMRATDPVHPASEEAGRGSVTSADVTFVDDLDEREIDEYIATGEPLHVAGAFTIDSLGAPFIERVNGDPSTVVGCSLPAVRRLVRSFGVGWTDLWASPHA